MIDKSQQLSVEEFINLAIWLISKDYSYNERMAFMRYMNCEAKADELAVIYDVDILCFAKILDEYNEARGIRIV